MAGTWWSLAVTGPAAGRGASAPPGAPTAAGAAAPHAATATAGSWWWIVGLVVLALVVWWASAMGRPRTRLGTREPVPPAPREDREEPDEHPDRDRGP